MTDKGVEPGDPCMDRLIRTYARSRDGIVIADEGGMVRWVNRTFRTLTGLEGQRLSGTPFLKIVSRIFIPRPPGEIPATDAIAALLHYASPAEGLILRHNPRFRISGHAVPIPSDTCGMQIFSFNAAYTGEGTISYEHLALLFQAAADISEASSYEDLFRHIGGSLLTLCPGSAILLFSTGQSGESVRIRTFEGTERQKALIRRLLKSGMTLHPSDSMFAHLQSGELELVAGIRDLFDSTLSAPASARFETAIGLRKMYYAGFSWKKTIYGGVVLFQTAESSRLELPVIEALIGQASVAIRQWQYEEALVQSEEKYRDLVHHANSVILKIDTNSRITFFNEYAQKFYGFSQDEVIGQSVFDTIVPRIDSNGTNLHESLPTFFENPEQHEETENENITRDGRRVWISWRNRIIRDKGGSVVGMLCVGSDITGQKKAISQLRSSERMYRTMFESSRDGIVLIKDNRIFDCNRRGEDLFGYAREELIGRQPFDLSPPNQPDGLPSSYRNRGYLNAALAGTPQLFEWQHQRADGTLFDAEISLTRMEILDESTLIVTVRDITERKRSENALKESELRYRSTINSMADPIHVIDRDFRIILVNDAFRDWFTTFGFTTDIIGNHLFRAIPVLSKTILDEYSRVFADGIMLLSEEMLRVGDLELISETRKIPVFEEGKVVRVVTVVRDITAQRKIEVLKRQAFEQIENNLEQFAILNDHIRNPLQAIVGLADLEGGDLAEKIFTHAMEIDAIIKRLDIGWLESEKIRQFLRKHYGE
jgi:PAS domain S-box-containing protein